MALLRMEQQAHGNDQEEKDRHQNRATSRMQNKIMAVKLRQAGCILGGGFVGFVGLWVLGLGFLVFDFLAFFLFCFVHLFCFVFSFVIVLGLFPSQYCKNTDRAKPNFPSKEIGLGL